MEAFGTRRARCELCVLRGERGRVCSGGRLALRAGVTLCLQAQKSQNSSSVLLQLHHGISRSPSPCPLESHQISEDGAGGLGGWQVWGFCIICLHQIPRRPATTVYREVTGHPSAPVTARLSVAPIQRPSRAARFQLLLRDSRQPPLRSQDAASLCLPSAPRLSQRREGFPPGEHIHVVFAVGFQSLL